MAGEEEQVKDEETRPECARPTIEEAFQYAGSLEKRIANLERRAGHVSYEVGCLQGEAARRKRLYHDFTLAALGIYVGLIVAYIIVSN